MKAKAINKKGEWRVSVEIDGGNIFIRNSKNGILFKYKTFDSKEDAENYIKNHKKLELKEA